VCVCVCVLFLWPVLCNHSRNRVTAYVFRPSSVMASIPWSSHLAS